ncbi:hypothetical protein KsCSTR_35090 [Candidatus Kuenenia stuttgartiensis]|uniref:Uncharacterized protein n=1 Tax=Kuenenia stuttgartiensis TaxID=174633 RepID=Q1Q6U2_KUEST|nr:hypothetical protein KsCSTR_35090 [Candidatus Kuenenia stuttgartiensis]CAJ73301.1 unknown protein [Candidatus Kuenenia stuttgartiensis]
MRLKIRNTKHEIRNKFQNHPLIHLQRGKMLPACGGAGGGCPPLEGTRGED